MQQQETAAIGLAVIALLFAFIGLILPNTISYQNVTETPESQYYVVGYLYGINPYYVKYFVGNSSFADSWFNLAGGLNDAYYTLNGDVLVCMGQGGDSHYWLKAVNVTDYTTVIDWVQVG